MSPNGKPKVIFSNPINSLGVFHCYYSSWLSLPPPKSFEEDEEIHEVSAGENILDD